MTSISPAATLEPGLRVEQVGAAGLITLDRPRQLNALDSAMRSAIAAAFPGFARNPDVYCAIIRSAHPRAFSAGSDVRELTALYRQDRDRALLDVANEYRLNWLLECFSKPTISLIDGLQMGSGVGISQYNTHRVAGAGYRFAMPETLIGLFPDVGVAHALARMPDQVGTFLGLTGRTIGRAEAYSLGIVTHCIDRQHYDDIQAELSGAHPVDAVLDKRHTDPGPGELAPYRETIAHCFAADTVSGIIERLEGTTGSFAAFAQGVLADLAKASPTSLAITLRHIRQAASRNLKATLEADYTLASHCLAGHDFAEGVRAMLVDKDNKPDWRPRQLSEVAPAIVEAHFATPATPLTLPSRAEMQAARF
jgi:enoyl-CoA hydratase